MEISLVDHFERYFRTKLNFIRVCSREDRSKTNLTAHRSYEKTGQMKKICKIRTLNVLKLFTVKQRSPNEKIMPSPSRHQNISFQRWLRTCSYNVLIEGFAKCRLVLTFPLTQCFIMPINATRPKRMETTMLSHFVRWNPKPNLTAKFSNGLLTAVYCSCRWKKRLVQNPDRATPAKNIVFRDQVVDRTPRDVRKIIKSTRKAVQHILGLNSSIFHS